MSRSGDLYELQSIDTQLDQHQKQLKEIAAILADQSEHENVEAELKRKEFNLKIASDQLKDAETKVKEQRLKIKTTDATLYSGKISSPKELVDLQAEGEALRRYLIVLEDRQLECMLEMDDRNAEYLQAKEKLERVSIKTAALHQAKIEEKKRLEAEVQNLQGRRQSAMALIRSDDLDRYEQLRKKAHGVAVTTVNNRSCYACGAILTAAHYQAARSPNQITLCETCGRILFA